MPPKDNVKLSGDIRRVQAVDIPQLRHLKNVIVFSTRGARDLPNKWVWFQRDKLTVRLGGGDLDGDGVLSPTSPF
jgi:RNA-dependent RNA polymerase